MSRANRVDKEKRVRVPARQRAGRLAKVAVGASSPGGPMRPHVDALVLTPEDRFREIAALLAVGLRRLHAQLVLNQAKSPGFVG